MKHFYFFLLSILMPLFMNAQIEEKQENFSLGMQPSLTTYVKDISPKGAAKLWKKFFKEYGKVKKNSKAKEYYSTGVRINRIKSGDPVDVYIKFSEYGTETKINLCIDLGTAILSKAEFPDEYSGAEDFLEEFSIYVQRYVVENQLKDEEKKLNKLNKKLRKAKKENQKLHSKIETYKDKIKKAENDIELNLKTQEDLENQIDDQSLKVKEIQEKLRNIGK